MAKGIKFRDKSEIMKHGLHEAERICCVLEKKDADNLRGEAFTNNTTVAEIIRTLVRSYLDSLDKSRQKQKEKDKT